MRGAEPPEPALENDGSWRDVFISVSDGLLLHARDYGPRGAATLPLVCLAGLTRHAADFHSLARRFALSPRRPRRVVAIDSRGRGRSQRDKDWRNYNVVTETRDALDLMTALGVHRAVLVGTSRGGILAMVMSALRPGAMAGVVLNDIGPVIEGRGLARIRSYLTATRPLPDWQAARDAMKAIMAGQFTAMTEADWMAYARATFAQKDGKPVPSFDPAITRTLEGVDFETDPPDLWPQFLGLADIPVLAIRGANSDLLSPVTLERMQAAHPRLTPHIVPDEGHAPLLADTASRARIAAFLREVEEG